jgi:hypothetical protein
MRLLLPLVLTACTACPPLAERPLVAACVVGDPLPEPVEGVRRLRLVGRVRTGGGFVDACADGWRIGSREPTPSEFGHWAELQGPDGRFVLGMWAEALPDVESGRERLLWTVDVRVEEGGASFVDIRDDTGGQVFWVGQAPDVATLQHPPGLIVDDGRPVCRGEGGCGEVRGRTLEVEVGGTRRELRPHERLEASSGFSWDPTDHTVVHGGYDTPIDPGACADDAQLTVAWWDR